MEKPNFSFNAEKLGFLMLALDKTRETITGLDESDAKKYVS